VPSSQNTPPSSIQQGQPLSVPPSSTQHQGQYGPGSMGLPLNVCDAQQQHDSSKQQEGPVPVHPHGGGSVSVHAHGDGYHPQQQQQQQQDQGVQGPGEQVEVHEGATVRLGNKLAPGMVLQKPKRIVHRQAQRPPQPQEQAADSHEQHQQYLHWMTWMAQLSQQEQQEQQQDAVRGTLRWPQPCHQWPADPSPGPTNGTSPPLENGGQS